MARLPQAPRSTPIATVAALLLLAAPGGVHADSLGPASVASSLPEKSALPMPPRLRFSVDYAAMLQTARGDKDATARSGVARAYGQIELYGSPGRATGVLNFKIENRHGFGDLAPQDLGFATGYVGLPATTFSQVGTILTNLYWQHTASDNRWAFVAGIVDVTDYVDVYAFVNPWRDFSNFVFSTNPTMPAPNQGFGLAARTSIGSNGYILGGMADLDSDPADPGSSVSDFFDGQATFKHLEIGYVGSFENRFNDNIHLTFWQSDALPETGVTSGRGAALSASWQVTDRLTPFVRIGIADGGGALYEQSAAAGFGFATGREDDVIGVGLNWSKPNKDSFGSDPSDQTTFEAYWRLSFLDHVEITPDVQYVDNPALAPGSSDLWYLGLRLRVVF